MKQLGVILLIIACICGCKRDNDDNIRHNNLRIVINDEFTGGPVRNLPITILEFETSKAGGWFTAQKEIFVGKTDANGEVKLDLPVKKDHTYRFWKKEPTDIDTASMDWCYFSREYFIRGDTFPEKAEMILKASGVLLVYIADTAFARTGSDSVSVKGADGSFVYPRQKSKYFYFLPNKIYDFNTKMYKGGIVANQFTEKIFVENYFKTIGPDGTQVHQLKLP